MNITQVKIGPRQFNEGKWQKLLHKWRKQYFTIGLVKDENYYCAEAIEHDGKYFYRVDGVTVEAKQYEYEQVIVNPQLYYFSCALKLHHRIKKAKELGIGYYWPENAAAPIDVFTLENQTRSQS